MAQTPIELRRTFDRTAQTKLERFPVTILLGVQLLAMIVVPAIVKNTEPLGLIVGICLATIAVAFYVELVLQPLRPPAGGASSITPSAAVTILTIGMLATIISALGGRGSYAVQIGIAHESPVVAITTPFTVWMLVGVGIFLWLFRRGEVSRKSAVWVAILVCCAAIWEGLYRAILGQSVALIVTVLVLSVLARLVRFRVIVIALLLIPILWPPIYEAREALRRATTNSSAITTGSSPLDRLQLDDQMAQISQLVPRPQGLEAPDLLSLIRIGLLPGFLDDESRPTLDTGSRLSVALGGSSTNSQSATMLGNIFIFEGWLGVVFFAAILAIAMRWVLARDSPWAFAYAGLIYLSAISFNASYPDVIPRLLQATVSMGIAVLFVRLLAVFRESYASRRARNDPRSQKGRAFV